jgi:hypothetical protein
MGGKWICVRVKFRLQDRENITTLWRVRGREVDLAASEYGFVGRMVRM